MKTFEIVLNQNICKIKIGIGLSTKLGSELEKAGFQGKTVVITNPVINSLYGEFMQTSLEKSGFKVNKMLVPDGESYKSLQWAGNLYEQLAEIKAERTTPIIAFGGGVIGDLAGFVAATFMRGIPLIQVPTTLLAQVDASIGGKTAVNHFNLKNMIGAFYQPRMIITDIALLRSLPDREMENGLAEVIKYGIIMDYELFNMLETRAKKLKSTNSLELETIINRCVKIKTEIVKQDEKDKGIRNILNFGHTIGHALESASDFKLSHGMGVGLGILAESLISNRMNILKDTDVGRIKKVISNAGLPVKIPDLDLERILELMQHDKKRITGKNIIILPKNIGTVFIEEQVELKIIKEVLRELS